MQPNGLEKRVEMLERTVEGLSELPARVKGVEEQILQFRAETRAEFATVRGEASEFRAEMYVFKEEMHEFRREVREEFVQVRAEIRVGDEETRVLMRVLHEEERGRIRLLAEGVDLNRQRLDTLQATIVTRAEFQSFKEDVTSRLVDLAKFQKDTTALLTDIASRLPRRRRPRS
jgi:hypothetical protein